jgi:tryptophan-rich sensory protein
MASKVRQFFDHIVPGVIRPLRVLWNEIIGFVFLVLAAWSVPSTWRAWREFNQKGDTDNLFRLVLAGIFAALMIWFGLTSFLRARRIGRTR